jgi:hypothetical protein
LAPAIPGQDPVFSGPQRGEKITPFRVIDLASEEKGKERDPIAEGKAAPMAIVFVHGLERSLVPLLRVIDQYGAERKDRIRSEVVFLGADRLAGEERARAAVRSLGLRSRAGFSVDGAEGPGNYGLNKDCLMTVLAAKDDRVEASFALVQPGISDAPAIIRALAEACGDASPPTPEELLAKQGDGRRRGEMPRMRDEKPVDLAALDLSTEAGLREAVRALIGEVTRLRAEVAELHRSRPGAEARPARKAAGEDFPGAVPADPRLNELLRRAIRPDQDDAAVDRTIAEIEAHVKGNADLTKQAIDGWTRVLHFGDRYGTAHSRKAGAALLERLRES